MPPARQNMHHNTREPYPTKPNVLLFTSPAEADIQYTSSCKGCIRRAPENAGGFVSRMSLTGGYNFSQRFHADSRDFLGL